MFPLTTTGQFPSYYKSKLTRPKENFHFLIISNINLYYGTTAQVNRISFNAHVQRRVLHSERKVYQVAIFAIENYRQCYQFCKINGSARIHISVNLWRFSWWHELILFPPWVNLWRHHLTFPPGFEFMTSSSTAGHEGLECALHKTILLF